MGRELNGGQLRFDLFAEHDAETAPALHAALEAMATATGAEGRGAVFTRPEVADFILDLLGYTAQQPLWRQRILEPSFGAGDFIFPILERLLASWRTANLTEDPMSFLAKAIRGVELHADTFIDTRDRVVARLAREGFDARTAGALAGGWLRRGDFLLAPENGTFDFVAGNPPYVRQELIPEPLLAEYRRRYRTMYDRADLYIAFIERSLSLLAPGGSLGFICADRWLKNRYGGPLRSLVARDFHLKIYVDMVDTPAFHSDVIAYPAITIINRAPAGPTRVARQPAIDARALAALAAILTAPTLPAERDGVRELRGVANGADPWLIASADHIEMVRHLERHFPALEEAGCHVGIGVATGADKAFIGRYDALNVEADRKLRLATTADIATGRVEWRGLGVINPFGEDGRLVELASYPQLARYLEERREVIAARHCARNAPAAWYRTIDRIVPQLARTPKLLIPDIKGAANVVYEPGELYPHHNLYYITSQEWDLRALQAVLLSDVIRDLIAGYSTRMRGGFLRFQAQYLRRIRIPRWDDVSEALREQLRHAAILRDVESCNSATRSLYGLDAQDPKRKERD